MGESKICILGEKKELEPVLQCSGSGSIGKNLILEKLNFREFGY